ncbi:hypothetical protein ACHAPI_012272 [Fusarium lateritium]
MAFPDGSLVGSDISKLRDNDDDNGSKKVVFIATWFMPLPLPDLLANVLLLVAEEKSKRSVPELTALVGTLLSDTAGKEAPDEQYLTDLPKTLSRYERKLKKFVSQWHTSLVEKGIPEHLAYELAKHYV